LIKDHMGLWFTMGMAVHYRASILWPKKKDVHVHKTLLAYLTNCAPNKKHQKKRKGLLKI